MKKKIFQIHGLTYCIYQIPNDQSGYIWHGHCIGKNGYPIPTSCYRSNKLKHLKLMCYRNAICRRQHPEWLQLLERGRQRDAARRAMGVKKCLP